MKVYGFCIHDSEPFNSTRYYAHFDADELNATIMSYTKNGYEEIGSVSFIEGLDIEYKYDSIRKFAEMEHRSLQCIPKS